MEFDLIPFRSVGAVNFDMSQSEVVAILGADFRTKRTQSALRISYAAESLLLLLDLDNRLKEVEVLDIKSKVRLDGAVLWGTELLDVAAQDSDAYIYGSVLICPTLGFASTGFHDSRPEETSVTCFRRGTWDHYVSRGVKWNRQW